MNQQKHFYLGTSSLFSNLTKNRLTDNFKNAEKQAIEIAKKHGGNPIVEYIIMRNDKLQAIRTYNVPIAYR